MKRIESPFLHRLADRIAEETPQLWRHVLVILPSRRAALHLRELLFDRAKKAFVHPIILTSESWAQELVGGNRISAAEELAWLYEAYRETHAPNAESFDAFLKWASLFISDLNEADRYLCPLDELYKFTSDIKRLEKWEVSDEEQQTEMVKNYLRFWTKLGSTQERYHQKCRERNTYPQGLSYRIAANEFSELWPKWKEKNQINRIFLAGLNAFNKAEEDMFKHLLEDNAEILFDLPKVLEDNIQESGKFIRKYLKWDVAAECVQEVGAKRKHQILRSPGGMAQLQLAGDILRNLIKAEGPEVLQRTALVMADEQWLLPMLSALPEEIEKVNITMGLSLAEHPMTQLFNRWIQLFSDQEDHFYRTRLLHDSANALNQLCGEKLFDLSELSSRSRLNPEEWTAFWESQNIEGLPIRHGINALEAIKLLLHWLTPRIEDSIQNMCLAEIGERIKQIEWIDQNTKAHSSIHKLEMVFNLFMKDARLDFQGEPLEGLQIMGILESRSLEFDYLICTSLNEGILPKGRPVNSLFPPEVRKTYHLPDHGDKDSIYGYHFLRLLARSKKSWLLYGEGGDNLSATEPSRFLLQLEQEWPSFYGSDFEVSKQTAVVGLGPAKAREFIPKTAKHCEQLQKMAKRGLSPSALSSYIREPIQFYLRYLSGIKDQELSRKLDSAGFGSAYHKTLELFYQDYIGKVLVPELLEKRKKELPQIIQEALILENIDLKDLRGQEGLGHDMLHVLLEKSIEMDIQRAGKQEIVIVSLEETLETEIGPGIRIRGKSDRIERVDQEIQIVDYKTGYVDRKTLNVSFKTDFRDIQRSQAFQLLCYSLMLRDHFPGEEIKAAISFTREWSKGLAQLTLDKNPTIAPDYLDHFQDVLLSLIEELLDPNINFENTQILDLEE